MVLLHRFGSLFFRRTSCRELKKISRSWNILFECGPYVNQARAIVFTEFLIEWPAVLSRNLQLQLSRTRRMLRDTTTPVDRNSTLPKCVAARRHLSPIGGSFIILLEKRYRKSQRIGKQKQKQNKNVSDNTENLALKLQTANAMASNRNNDSGLSGAAQAFGLAKTSDVDEEQPTMR